MAKQSTLSRNAFRPTMLRLYLAIVEGFRLISRPRFHFVSHSFATRFNIQSTHIANRRVFPEAFKREGVERVASSGLAGGADGVRPARDHVRQRRTQFEPQLARLRSYQ